MEEMRELVRGNESYLLSAQIALEAEGIPFEVFGNGLEQGQGPGPRIMLLEDSDYDRARQALASLQSADTTTANGPRAGPPSMVFRIMLGALVLAIVLAIALAFVR
jgi:hypothetical protein